MSKYKALVIRLGLAKALKAFPLYDYKDSQLIVSQYQGIFKTRNPILTKYLQKVKTLLSRIENVKKILITQISREENMKANLISKLVSFNLIDLPLEVWIKFLRTKHRKLTNNCLY